MNDPRNTDAIEVAATMVPIARQVPSTLKLLPPGTVVMPKRGAAIATNKKRLLKAYAAMDPNLIGVVPGPLVAPRYLAQWFETFDLRDVTDTSTLPQLNKKDLEPVLMPVPPRAVQEDISRMIQAAERHIKVGAARRNALTALFTSLLHHLMTGQLRVTDLDLAPQEAQP